MKSYHVRVHYRTGNKVQRKVSWFRSIKADSDTDAGNKAINRVTTRKTNTGIVEVESVEVLEKRPVPTGERAKIVAWLRGQSDQTTLGDGYSFAADAIEAGEHLK